MNITSVQHIIVDDENIGYKLISNELTMIVPIDTNNRHYQAIQEWVAEGNTIQESD
jgi:hypothetical protein